MAARVPPPPPRFTADPQANFIILANWLQEFFNAAVLEGYFLNVVEESQQNPVNPSDLPDPATTTLATAQKTANDAYVIAQATQQTANAANNRVKDWLRGEVTISESDTTAEIVWPEEQPDTNYMVLIQTKETVGAPSLDATLVIEKTYATDKCTITVNGAPGSGASVTFDWVMIRGFDAI